MTLASEHPNPLAVLDAVIADMRASGHTGHVENLLQARADFAQLVEAARLLNTCPHCDLGDLVYHIRERELLGWDGPAVVQWSTAVQKLKASLSLFEVAR